MQRSLDRRLAVAGLLVCLLAGALPGSALAARVGLLTNKHGADTAVDFNAHVGGGHTFTFVDTSANVPSLATLQANFDVLLVYEDGVYANAPAVGDVVAAFAHSRGKSVVLGTFYDQDRSDNGSPAVTPHGWGALETIDPNTTDGTGTPYAPRTLNAAALVAHPLTAGVTSLTSASFAGGNEAKPGTTVVANWNQANARGHADPAIAYRITNGACVIHVAIAPQYPSIGVAGTDFSGDFYRVWRNAFDFGVAGCVGGPVAVIPTLSAAGLAGTALVLAAFAALALSRRRAGAALRRPPPRR